MRESEAARLVAALAAYWPHVKLTEETAQLWEHAILDYDSEDGATAVHSFGTMGRFMPSLAEFIDGIRESEQDRFRDHYSALPGPLGPVYTFSQFLSEHPDMAERVKALTTSTAATKPFPSTGQLGLVALLEGEIRA